MNVCRARRCGSDRLPCTSLPVMVTSADLPVLDLVQELGEADVCLLGRLAAVHHGEQQHRHANQNHPKDQCLDIRIHETSVPAPTSLDAAPPVPIPISPAASDFPNPQNRPAVRRGRATRQPGQIAAPTQWNRRPSEPANCRRSHKGIRACWKRVLIFSSPALPSGLVPVARPPAPQFQRTGQTAPV